MANITWRNVAAPDFSTSLAGIRTASDAFSRGITGLRDSIQEIDGNISDRVNAAFQTALLGYNDADAVQSALAADPTLGFDQRRLNAESLRFASDRPATLLREAASRQNMDIRGYEHDRTVDRNARLDAAQPIAAQAQTMFGQGQNREALALLSNSAEFQALDIQDQQDILDGGLGLTRDDVSITGDRQRQSITGTEFGNRQQDRAEGRNATSIAEQIIGVTPTGDTMSALGRLESLNLDPMVRAQAREQIISRMGRGNAGSIISAAASIGGGGDSSRIMNYQARDAGFANVPDSVQTLGDASDFAIQVNRAGVPSSAMGTYQIVGQTMRGYAPRVFGENWRDVNFDLEAQDQLARAIFEDNNGSAADLRRQWVSLSQADAERIRQLPWEQAREVIAAGESSSSPAAMFANRDNLALRGAVAAERETAAGDTNAWAEGLGENAAPITVAQRLSENIGGGSAEQLTPMIQQIVNRSKVNGRETINAVQAGNILQQNLNQDVPFYDFWSEEVNGLRFDQEGIDRAISDARSGANVDRLENRNNSEAATRNALQLRSQLDAINGQIQATRLAMISRPAEGARLPQLQAQQAAIMLALDQAGQELPDAPRSGETWDEANRMLFDGGSLLRVRRSDQPLPRFQGANRTRGFSFGS